MAKKWTLEEEVFYKNQLCDLYVVKNLSLKEVASLLNIKQQTVFARLERLGIKTEPHKKVNYRNTRNDVKIPTKYSNELAELFGILLGDGHISHFQMIVTLGAKESSYVLYIQELISKIFGTKPKVALRKTAIHNKYYRDIYLGSVKVTRWLLEQGLVYNKVKSQVTIPNWIYENEDYIRSCIRGLFDTDGSIYKIKFGIQISFCNHSLPILESLQKMLKKLQFHPSNISSWQIYITRTEDVERFFREIRPSNQKHLDRYLLFKKNASVG